MNRSLIRSASSRRRRLLGAGLGAAALALGGLAAFHVPASGADTNRPAVFSGGAAAAALHEEENGQAGFAVYEPFYGSFAEGATSYSNDGQIARASTFYPGPTFGNTGSLICQLNCEPVPAYPLSVQTEGPPQPTSVSQQTSTNVGGPGQPSSLTAASADASADPATGVSTDAVDGTFSAPGQSAPAPPAAAPASTSSLSSPTGSASVSGGRLAAVASAFFRQASLILHRPVTASSAAASSAVVAVKSMTASTAQHFSGSTLVSDAETDLSGVSLLGGIINIASIDTQSHSKTDGAGVHTHTDNVTVSGTTVAGQPATIGSNGVTLSGQGTGSALLDSLNAALQQALAAANADVTLVGATAKPPQPLGGGCTGDQADGVFVHTSANAQSAPLVGDVYNGDYTLGSSCTSVSASSPGASLPSPAALLPGATTAPGAGGTAATGSAAAVPTDTGSLGGSSAALGGGGEATGNQAASPGGRGSPRSVATTTGLLGPFVSRRFSTLYLSVVLALAAVLVGLGFHVPRPRAGGAGRRSGP